MVSCPTLNLGTQPELYPSAGKVDYWTRHVVVAGLVLAHCVAVRETEDLGDGLGVDEVVDVDFSSHAPTLHPSAAEPYERKFSVRGVR